MNEMFNQFNGIDIVEMPPKGYEQHRTHRKPRINKKWRKRYGVYPVYEDDDVAYVVDVPGRGKVLYCSRKAKMMIEQHGGFQ